MELTPRARLALEHARRLAAELGHASISSQHILFGLLQLGNGVQFHVLSTLGFTSDSVRKYIAAEPAVGSAFASGPAFDISAPEALRRAEGEAKAMTHGYTGTEHILLALLSEEHGGAARLFASRDVDCAKLRQTILNELQPGSR